MDRRVCSQVSSIKRGVPTRTLVFDGGYENRHRSTERSNTQPSLPTRRRYSGVNLFQLQYAGGESG